MAGINRIKRWLGRVGGEAEAEAEGLEPVATPPAEASGDSERETSTNAQTQGARDEPWPGNR